MNPYQNIDKKNGLKDDEKSPFYGCFSLYFDQVYPFREPSPYGGASIKVKKDFVEEAETVYDLLSGSSNSLDYPATWAVQRLFHFHQQKDFKHDQFTPINCFNEEDYFFVLDQVSTNIWIAMENFYFALLELSSFLEDFQFFVYSSDKKWLDEYKNQDGQLTCNQWLCDIEAYYDRLIYYINRTNETPTDNQFKLFTTWQLYNKLKNMVGWNTVLEGSCLK